jgi:hypothetical protein
MILGLVSRMRVAMADLGLQHLWVVHPGDDRYALDERIDVVGLAQLRVELQRVLDGRPRRRE